jgi:hypothetical protein
MGRRPDAMPFDVIIIVVAIGVFWPAFTPATASAMRKTVSSIVGSFFNSKM